MAKHKSTYFDIFFSSLKDFNCVSVNGVSVPSHTSSTLFIPHNYSSVKFVFVDIQGNCFSRSFTVENSDDITVNLRVFPFCLDMSFVCNDNVLHFLSFTTSGISLFDDSLFDFCDITNLKVIFYDD